MAKKSFPSSQPEKLISMMAVSVRLDSGVLDWLKSKGEGHLTCINDIPANLMEAETKGH